MLQNERFGDVIHTGMTDGGKSEPGSSPHIYVSFVPLQLRVFPCERCSRDISRQLSACKHCQFVTLKPLLPVRIYEWTGSDDHRGNRIHSIKNVTK